jgi:tRNA (guanine37-N1)-methyltransferase
MVLAGMLGRSGILVLLLLLGPVRREWRWLSLPEAVHKVSAKTAERFGMAGRGRLVRVRLRSNERWFYLLISPWLVGLIALPVLAAGPPGRLVVPTPAGRPFTQATAQEWATADRIVFACGRYEGIDQRVVEHFAPVEEVSIGDYVLAGGEAAALVIIEAVGRLLPGVLGNASSAGDDSFGGDGDPGGAMRGLLEGPVYTRPRAWREREVPEVLLSGHHAAIARWRRDMALRRTAAHRPDLLATLRDLDRRDREVLAEAGFPVSAEDMAH